MKDKRNRREPPGRAQEGLVFQIRFLGSVWTYPPGRLLLMGPGEDSVLTVQVLCFSCQG